MEEEKEEIVTVKKITHHELEELKRLHTILDQAPNRKIGYYNLKEEAMKNVTDYHMALSKKYNFNPRKIGINRHTGDLQPLPDEVTNPQRAKMKKRQEEQYDPLSSRRIGYRSCREG